MGVQSDLRNPGCPLDLEWVASVTVDLPSVTSRVHALTTRRSLKGDHQVAWLLRAITCIDLTTLAGDDTAVNVARLCHKAANPVRPDILRRLLKPDPDSSPDLSVRCGAVCVYPARVQHACASLQRVAANKHVAVAAVATGFPSGQYSLSSRLAEIEAAVADGASEVDIVINRERALAGDWQTVYDEVCAMRAACGSCAHMKAILCVGELASLTNVMRAALVCMMAGADFIKTSTGKEAVNATLAVGVVMCRAIHDYHTKTGYKVGLKPAGGIRTAQQALQWLVLVRELLGVDWLNSRLFRIGASALLCDIERQLFISAFARPPASTAELPAN